MPLNLEQPASQLFIRSYASDGIVVGESKLTTSFILSPDVLVPDWPVPNARELSAQHLNSLLSLQPELVLLGTGKQQIFPAPEHLMLFLREGIGIEVMNSDAACRTFNICAQEGRRVVAGIIVEL